RGGCARWPSRASAAGSTRDCPSLGSRTRRSASWRTPFDQLLTSEKRIGLGVGVRRADVEERPTILHTPHQSALHPAGQDVALQRKRACRRQTGYQAALDEIDAGIDPARAASLPLLLERDDATTSVALHLAEAGNIRHTGHDKAGASSLPAMPLVESLQ